MEIPIADLEGKLDEIRDGNGVVLILKANYHRGEKSDYYRFRCRVCDHRLSIPADKAHKKIQCTSCEAISRLSVASLRLELVESAKSKAQTADSQTAEDSTEASELDKAEAEKIQFECRDCRQQVRVPKEHAGKKGRCPNCRATVDIPYYSTAAGFRVKHSALQSPMKPVTSVKVNLAGPDLLKGYVPESPLQAGSWGSDKMVKPSTPTTEKTSVKRDGLPWENPPEQGGRFWPTCKLILFRPNTAFQQMYEDDGLGNPIGFAVAGHMMATILFAIAMIPVLIVACLLAAPHMPDGVDYLKLASQFGVGIGIWFGIGLLLIPIFMFCFGALLYAAAFVVGGTEKPFATTNRMMAYSLGANLQTLAVPFLGPVFFPIFWCVQMCCGLSKTQEKPMGQAIGAFLMATVIPTFFIGLLWGMAG